MTEPMPSIPGLREPFSSQRAFTKPEKALDGPWAHSRPVEPILRPRNIPFETEWSRSVIRMPEKPDSGYLSRMAHPGFAPDGVARVLGPHEAQKPSVTEKGPIAKKGLRRPKKILW